MNSQPLSELFQPQQVTIEGHIIEITPNVSIFSIKKDDLVMKYSTCPGHVKYLNIEFKAGNFGFEVEALDKKIRFRDCESSNVFEVDPQNGTSLGPFKIVSLNTNPNKREFNILFEEGRVICKILTFGSYHETTFPIGNKKIIANEYDYILEE